MSYLEISKMEHNKIGNISAAHLATILDANDNIIGTCLDTPNNAAYALLVMPKAMKVLTPYNGIWVRKYLKTRFFGLDKDYHSSFLNLI